MTKPLENWIEKTHALLDALPAGAEKDRAAELFAELVATLQLEF